MAENRSVEAGRSAAMQASSPASLAPEGALVRPPPRRLCRRLCRHPLPSAAHSCLQELVEVLFDGLSNRYAVWRSSSSRLICFVDSQVGAASTSNRLATWVRGLRPPVRRSTHGALLQEDADEVADVCAVKIALERSIPLESVAFKNEGALHDILPGLEVRRWHGDEHGREAWRGHDTYHCTRTGKPPAPTTQVACAAQHHSSTLVTPPNHAGGADGILAAPDTHAHGR